MGLIDDIKNIQPLSEHKWTLKELLKVEKKLLKKGQKSILKELMKKDNINDGYYCGIDLSNKESSDGKVLMLVEDNIKASARKSNSKI